VCSVRWEGRQRTQGHEKKANRGGVTVHVPGGLREVLNDLRGRGGRLGPQVRRAHTQRRPPGAAAARAGAGARGVGRGPPVVALWPAGENNKGVSSQ
jgi:hypothetical protein